MLAVVALSGVLVACGDDDGPSGTPDAGRDASMGGSDAGPDEDDAGSDAGEEPDEDAGTDGGTEPDPEPTVIALSETAHDRFRAVTFDAAGNVYAAGQIAVAANDFALVVAKFDADGELVEEFGEDGFVTLNLAENPDTPGDPASYAGDRENAYGIVVQPTAGRVVIAGEVEHDITAASPRDGDTDIVLVGFDTTTGDVDTDFGDEGVARFDLSTGEVSGTTLSGRDTVWSISLGAEERLVVHGTQRAVGSQPATFGAEPTLPRTDSIFALLRLSADGERDNAFGGGDGLVNVDIVGAPGTGNLTFARRGAGLSARSATVLPDGSIIGTGYIRSTALTEPADAAPPPDPMMYRVSQQPVLYKVEPDGDFDPDFAMDDETTLPGVWHDFAGRDQRNAEAYGAALQGTNMVTIGYGPTIQTTRTNTTDWVSFRFTEDGELDSTYGTGGSTYIDVGNWSDNGRAVIVLGDDRVLAVGGGRPDPATAPPAGEMPEVDAMVAVLEMNGAPDTTFGTNGSRLFDLGGTDFFWSVALSADESTVAVVGIAGADGAGADDDAVLYLLPVD
ncbi:RTX toxin protein [Sandaracinus amylolyticus]|uniref:RTX toxin protein n=1 Tax=Sandaracinus amylolyticus TaxID=927083 RepID=A0A0F6W786_9BACT|nr:RTX toxin protein [Sandaracinus amylolyticus]